MIPYEFEAYVWRSGQLYLLPTGCAVLLLGRNAPPVLVAPHRDVRIYKDAYELASLSPNFIKSLLGEPRKYVGRALTTTDHPMLEPFAGCAHLDQAVELIDDLRSSLKVTDDERDFLDLWREYRERPESLPTSDRWVERLCIRFAGQSPATLRTIARLARTLAADNESGLHNSLGAFADSSHFARVCRSYTGWPPTHWRHMSQTFY